MRTLAPLCLFLGLAGLACGGGAKCGEGTHEEDGACVPDGGGDSGLDSSGDTGDDSGGESGDDSGADSDSGEDTAPDEPTHTVCPGPRGEYATLAEAVAAALPGDHITLCEGVFEGATFDDLDVTVVGEGMEATTLDLGAGTGLRVLGSELRLEGVALTAAPATDVASVFVSGATLELRDVGIFDIDDRATSRSTSVFDLEGGTLDMDGVLVRGGSYYRRLFRAVDEADVLVLRRARVEDVEVDDYGVLMELSDAHYEVTNVIFQRVAQTGGGVLGTDFSDPSVEDEILRFLVFYDCGGGAGPNPAPSYVIYERGVWDDPVRCADCAVYDSSFTADDLGDYGSVDLDCEFVDPEGGDFHLSAGSPCRDRVYDRDLTDADGSAGDLGAYGGPYGSGW